MTLGSGNIVASACSGGDYYDPGEIRLCFRTLRRAACHAGAGGGPTWWRSACTAPRRRRRPGAARTDGPRRGSHRAAAPRQRRSVLRQRPSVLPVLWRVLPTLLLRALLLQSLLLRTVGAGLQR